MKGTGNKEFIFLIITTDGHWKNHDELKKEIQASVKCSYSLIQPGLYPPVNSSDHQLNDYPNLRKYR
jgi:hypothetical protein